MLSIEPQLASGLSEVRYSLAELLREVRVERASSDLGKEFVDQDEIKKRFSNKKRVRRRKS